MEWTICTKEIREAVEAEMQRLDSMTNLQTTVYILWNDDLRTTAGRVKGSVSQAVIELNKQYLHTFGLENLLCTLRHEVAHIVAWNCGDMGHGGTFKAICQKLGGTMNEQLAANGAPSAGTKEYIKTPYKYEFHCPNCDMTFKRKKMLTGKVIQNNVCKKCKTPVKHFTYIKL